LIALFLDFQAYFFPRTSPKYSHNWRAVHIISENKVCPNVYSQKTS
jgi:hypothetical protein